MDLSREVKEIKGVGEKTAEALNKAGIFSVRDLLYYLPRDYENYQASTKISEIRPGKVIVKGKIDSLRTNRTRRRNFTVTEGVIRDNSGAIRVVWFNQPYRAKQFDPKKEYYFTGDYDFKSGKYQLTSPSAVLATEVDSESVGFQPIYPQRGALKPQNFKKIFKNFRTNFAQIPDILPITGGAPDFVYQKSRAEALYNIHFPENQNDVASSRRYLAYEELFELLLAAKLNKQTNQKLKAESLPFVAKNTKALTSSLKFQLTNAQKRATWDILQDLEKTTPMNRLIQGDVGSGKTIVAAIAAFQATKAGSQVALLAPTAILAAQHAESLSEILSPLGVNIGLLVGSTKRKDELKKHIKNGDVDLIIGTHAILTDDTIFNNLSLCIIDEQHRFGVGQRQKLLLKSKDGLAPHLLSMTATPIPRSLQLTIFGDLDISVINELPKGRQPIITKILKENNLKDDLYPKIREKLAQKQQVYWICKAIEDNPQTETMSVKKQTKRLQENFPKHKVEFLHGRMKQVEKDEIMSRFANGEIDILVSTTVVEVGVNVPNASIIVIMDAENYGLAQLHQLRGRVGRGNLESFCYLISTGENQPSRRLRELEKSTDGFYLAEVDLSLRGPGEIYGNLQHGALDLRIATLTDTPLISRASKQAESVALEFAKHPENMVKYKELNSCIQKYQQLTTLN